MVSFLSKYVMHLSFGAYRQAHLAESTTPSTTPSHYHKHCHPSSWNTPVFSKTTVPISPHFVNLRPNARQRRNKLQKPKSLPGSRRKTCTPSRDESAGEIKGYPFLRGRLGSSKHCWFVNPPCLSRVITDLILHRRATQRRTLRIQMNQ